jgi:tripartite-type tricarboxylate transporter receptor subunit TctC
MPQRGQAWYARDMVRLALLVLALAAVDAAAQAYPARQVRFVVVNPPGIASDTMVRGYMQFLVPKSVPSIMIDNRVGADGAIGMDNCARSPADGYNFCIGSNSTLVFNPFIRSKLPYDPARDFTPVLHLGYFDSGLLVNASVPAKSVQELVDLAKAKPNSISWAIFGFGSTGNMYAQWLRKSRGVEFLIVPYKTPTQMLQALSVGEVQAGVQSIGSTAAQVAAGKLRVLAVSSDKRHPSLPSVPTLAEAGIKLPLRGWYGIVAPMGSPPDAIRWWNAEVTKLSADPPFSSKFLAAEGILFTPNSPEEFGAMLKTQREAFGDLIRYLEVKPE